MLPALELPPYPFKLKDDGGKLKLFDPLRRKWMVWTPEEWVRQHFIQYLIIIHGFPGGLFSLERGVKHHQTTGRYDVIIHNRKGEPYVLVECKAPTVSINEETLFQASRYVAGTGVVWILITNGLIHYAGKIEPDGVLKFSDKWPSPEEL